MSNPEQLLIRREARDAVRDAVSCLEPRYQRLVWRWAEGADLTEHQLSVVRVALRAARCFLGRRDEH
jgi:hypothetical protein